MCGRFTLTDPDPRRLRARFGLDESAKLEEGARYNIAPTDPVLAVRRARDGRREAGRLRWGLVPGRWAERRSGGPLINARVETLRQQGAFAESFRERRCLIPADGFYEWRKDEAGSTPLWISRSDSDLFAFAGIWAALPARDGSAELHSCAIVTCEPNELIRPLHDRMPVVLMPELEARWLDPEASEEDLLSVLVSAPDGLLVAREVGDAVNDVRDDGPHLLEPRQRQPQPQLF
ncbi:MAG TPA: SOS response-associated peptidase [Solirubrobacterales bacterium]|nr:SOS response-associated peptidase [Solirubrobacterales bacterium]